MTTPIYDELVRQHGIDPAAAALRERLLRWRAMYEHTRRSN